MTQHAWVNGIGGAPNANVHGGTRVATPNIDALTDKLALLPKGAIVCYDKLEGQPHPAPDKWDHLLSDLVHSHRALNDRHTQNAVARRMGLRPVAYVGSPHFDIDYFVTQPPEAVAHAVYNMTGRPDCIVLGSMMTQISRMTLRDRLPIGGESAKVWWVIDMVNAIRALDCAVAAEGHETTLGRQVFDGIFLTDDAFTHKYRTKGAYRYTDAKRFGPWSMVSDTAKRDYWQDAARKGGFHVLTRLERLSGGG